MTSYPRHIAEQILRERPQFPFVDLSIWVPESQESEGGKDYNPSQPRDDHGRFASTGSSSGLHATIEASEAYDTLNEDGLADSYLQMFSGDASPKHKLRTDGRAQAVSKLLKAGTFIKDAVLHLPEDKEARTARITEIATGVVSRAHHEYKDTPVCDLEILAAIRVDTKPVGGQAVCEMVSRTVRMGSTSVTGDFRHELGHAVRAAMGGKDGFNGETYATEYIHERYKEAMAKVKANPAGLNTKLSHEFYETEYGVIGRRALDNWEENFAEHYRGYHKAIYQTKKGENPKTLAQYRERFPKWADFWDAYYTPAAMLKNQD